MKNINLKNLLSVLVLFCLLATTLSSCKSSSVVPPTTTETTTTTNVTTVIRDTVFEIQKDSSYYKAYVECINGKPVINQKEKVESKKGAYLQPPKVNLKDNILTVDCTAEAQKLFAQWKDVYIKENKSTIEKVPYPVPAEFSWWEKTQIILGRIFIGIAVLLGLGFAFKNRN
ncbi:hypothetical protein [Flavobacterium sp. UMI-01]|uniref:hypothetical protein n=1 Tax=Flavobacterium sp. UMI-01 TaxID=1441053 RepID=UPI001C7D2FEC|nr:hypothetical protein [Flavobacterium sp. UMI-01]GIZ10281.1 hypothetical protein FUMI01_30050 [Flavobacterium sp. UMI-01]